jgi:hypothetical protein
MSRNRDLSITSDSVVASHPIDAMVELCPPTIALRGRAVAAAWSVTNAPISTAMWSAKTTSSGRLRRSSAHPNAAQRH